MISGTFHQSAQEWRYFSREKTLIHTLHLAELPTRKRGDTVLIDSTAPSAGSNTHFNVPPLQMPSIPGSGVENITFNQNTLSTCFGSVGPNQTILAQRNTIIQFGVWQDAYKEILMTVGEAGWFYVWGAFQSGERGYEAPTGGVGGSTAHDFSISLYKGTSISAIGGGALASSAITMGGYLIWPTDPDAWRPTMYMDSILSNGACIIVLVDKGQFLRLVMTNISPPASFSETPTDLTMHIFKFAEP